jgi:hypothetical protein
VKFRLRQPHGNASLADIWEGIDRPLAAPINPRKRAARALEELVRRTRTAGRRRESERRRGGSGAAAFRCADDSHFFGGELPEGRPSCNRLPSPPIQPEQHRAHTESTRDDGVGGLPEYENPNQGRGCHGTRQHRQSGGHGPWD